MEILRALKSEYEKHHGIKISDEALQASAHLSHRYVSERFLPDKAVDLLDEAASRLRMETATMPDEPRELEERLQKPEQKGNAKIEDHARVTELREETDALREEYEQARERWLEENGVKDAEVGKEEVARVVSDRTGIPVGRMLKGEAERLLSMEAALHRRVIDQDAAVAAVAEAVRKARRFGGPEPAYRLL